MSLSLGPDVNVVLMPALARERLICGASSGTYLMQANSLSSSSSSSLPLRLTPTKGRRSNRFFVCLSVLFYAFLFFLLSSLFLWSVSVGGL